MLVPPVGPVGEVDASRLGDDGEPDAAAGGGTVVQYRSKTSA